MSRRNLKNYLESLYIQYNKKSLVQPDPLEFLYSYEDLKDREIIGLVASSLAYGRVAQILKSISTVIGIMGPYPAKFVASHNYRSLCTVFKGFKHRFADHNNLSALIAGASKVIENHGSLNKCFVAGMSDDDENILPGMQFFVEELCAGINKPGHLLALPEKGSACKRMNLYLRWMVRKDRVDLGGWEGISPSMLLIPLDTHMHRISLRLGLTKRKQANMKTVLEITAGFRKLSPGDPVKYDFTLTRFGIRDDMDIKNIIPG
jgi:uncharacterized protein (TIGR02757 family)